jgi:hypothetical protein
VGVVGQGAVDQNVAGIGCAQDGQQSRCTVDEKDDHRGGVGVSGAHRDAETGVELGEGVVPAQVHQAGESALVGRELAATVTLAGVTMSMVTHSTSA